MRFFSPSPLSRLWSGSRLGLRFATYSTPITTSSTPTSTTSTSPLPTIAPTTPKPRIVVLGCGWGGLRFVRDVQNYNLTLLAPRDHFVFTPLLASTTVGTLEHRSVLEAVRPLTAKHGFDYLQCEVDKIDFENNKVHCVAKIPAISRTYPAFEVSYDYLVVAVGAIPNTFNIPGVDQHAFSLKEIEDSRKIRQRIHDNFEASSYPGLSQQEIERLLTFVVVGGGPTGVEFAGELTDLIRADYSRLYPKQAPLARIIILEAGDHLLSGFETSLSNYALRHLRHDCCDIRLGHRVVKVEEDKVTLHDGTVIHTSFVLWSTGVQARPLIRTLDLAHLDNGKTHLAVEPDLKVKGTNNVYALGDCAALEKPLPALAQVAEQQAKFLAKHFDSALPKGYVFQFHSRGMLAYVGRYGGVATLGEHRRFSLSGFSAWLVWRGAYLTKLGSWRNRLQVPIDWLKTLLVGRDTSRV